jgi:glutathione peroxidase
MTILLALALATSHSTIMSFHELKTRSLDGNPVDLAQYRGKVVLVVNTASECGYTPQYEGLEKLYAGMKDRGLVVIGFPSNDFGKQEPGSAEQIQTFCRTKYGVKFPLMEKVKTTGEGQSPVYAFLSATDGGPKWNFHKYLVGKNGKVVKSFPSKVDPESPELKAAIETALK